MSLGSDVSLTFALPRGCCLARPDQPVDPRGDGGMWSDMTALVQCSPSQVRLERYLRRYYSYKLESAHHQQLMPSQEQVQCQECRRMFWREADRAWHKYVTERWKHICEQHGAVQCVNCHRWFRSRGGLSVHRCSPWQALT